MCRPAADQLTTDKINTIIDSVCCHHWTPQLASEQPGIPLLCSYCSYPLWNLNIGCSPESLPSGNQTFCLMKNQPSKYIGEKKNNISKTNFHFGSFTSAINSNLGWWFSIFSENCPMVFPLDFPMIRHDHPRDMFLWCSHWLSCGTILLSHDHPLKIPSCSPNDSSIFSHVIVPCDCPNSYPIIIQRIFHYIIYIYM